MIRSPEISDGRLISPVLQDIALIKTANLPTPRGMIRIASVVAVGTNAKAAKRLNVWPTWGRHQTAANDRY